MRIATAGFCLSLGLGALGCGSSMHTTTQVTRVVAVSEAGGEQNGSPVVVTAQSGAWLEAAAGQQTLTVGSDGTVHIGIWVRAPQATQQQVVMRRVPMDVSLVVDVSGSMAGDKIQNARMAAASLIESLALGDIVSVYAFSDNVMEVAPPTTVSNETRGDLIQRVNQLQTMGSTNMFDGLRVGEARAAAAPPTHAVRRVVLISDGMANVGPSSPEELGRVASDGSERNVQVSSIGVGLEYDERTLGAIAMRSAGRMYHLAQPSQMAMILRQELQTLSQTVATEAVIELEPAEGVELLDAENVSAERVEGGRLRVRLGALQGGQVNEVLVRARANTQSAVNDRALVQAAFVARPAGQNTSMHRENIAMRYSVSADSAAAARTANGRVQAMEANFVAANAQITAAQAMNANNTVEAERQLALAEQRLRSAAAQSNVAAPQREMLLRRAESVHRGRAANAAPPSPARPAANRANGLDMYDDAMNAYGH